MVEGCPRRTTSFGIAPGGGGRAADLPVALLVAAFLLRHGSGGVEALVRVLEPKRYTPSISGTSRWNSRDFRMVYWETHPGFVHARVRPCRVENSDGPASILLACPNIGPEDVEDRHEATGRDHLAPGGSSRATGIKPVD